MKRLALAALGLAVAAGLVLGLSFYLRPFWWFEKLGRAALRGAGLQRAQVDGPRGPVVYWHGGQGPTVVLLHGANDQAGAWGRIAKPLAASYRLVVVDLPGHGESGPADGPLGVPDLVEGFDAVLAAESTGGPVSLVGNSLGGWLAMIAAHTHPAKVAHVVLLNGAAVRAEPGVRITLLPRTREEARTALAALTAPGAPPVPGFVLDDLVRRSAGSPLERLMAAPLPEDLVPEHVLPDFPVPVTLLWGEADKLMPVAYAEKVRAGLRAARLEVLPGCGHVPQRECPDATVAALRAALASPPAPSAAVPASLPAGGAGH